MREPQYGEVSLRTVSSAAHRRRETDGTDVPITAFVLSGGASLAAAQVGMLQALYERGIEPDFLVGMSAGALNAAFVASRPQMRATATKLGRVCVIFGARTYSPSAWRHSSAAWPADAIT